MERFVEVTIKWLVLLALLPVLLCVAIRALITVLMAVLPLLLLVALVAGAAAGLTAGLLIRRRLPPLPRGEPIPPGTPPLGSQRVRRPQGRRG